MYTQHSQKVARISIVFNRIVFFIWEILYQDREKKIYFNIKKNTIKIEKYNNLKNNIAYFHNGNMMMI